MTRPIRPFSTVRSLLALALAVTGLSGGAWAAQLDTQSCPKAEMRLVVLGDSLADGLWGSLYRSFARCDTMQILRLTEVSDGLARTPAEEWLERYADAAARTRDPSETDVVIVQIGANDITTIRDGRSRVSFETEDWRALYTARVADLTEGLAARAAEVFWFGLPVVGKSELEGPYRTISALQADAAEAVGATFVDIHDATKFGAGSFTMNGKVGGQLRQLRATDQVHFTKAGYDYVVGEIEADLKRLIRNRDRRAALKDVHLQ